MKDLLSKFKPILKKEGVLYPAPQIKEKTDYAIVLEDIEGEASFTSDYLNNRGKILGFKASYKLTGDPYYIVSLVSRKIGSPGIHVVLESAVENRPVDYAKTLNSALYKAHEYLFNKIIDGILHPDKVYINLLDKTKIGIKKFKEREKNKANLSEEEKESKSGSLVNMKKYSKLEQEFGSNE